MYGCVRAYGHAKKLSLTPINIRIRMSACHVSSNNSHTIKHMFLIHFISFHLMRSTIAHIVYIVIQRQERKYIIFYVYFAVIPHTAVCHSIFITCSAVYGWVHFLFLSFRFIGFFSNFFLSSFCHSQGMRYYFAKERKKKWNEPHIIETNRLEIFLWIFLFHSKHLYKC